MILDNRSLDDIMIEFVKDILAAIRDYPCLKARALAKLFFHMKISRRIYLGEYNIQKYILIDVSFVRSIGEK